MNIIKEDNVYQTICLVSIVRDLSTTIINKMKRYLRESYIRVNQTLSIYAYVYLEVIKKLNIKISILIR